MAGFSNAKADMGFVKKRLDQNIAAGEKLLGAEYWATIEGYEGISILFRTAQLPEQARQQVEDTIPGGLTMTQYGAYKNNGEMPMQCSETIDGKVLAAVREIVINKKYVTVKVQAAAESNSGDAKGLTRTLGHCLVFSDAVDLSSEDMTQVVKPNLRIVYNWVDA
ncbi:baseplate protein [Pantoea sp. LMR881]|uniref:baseplate protein n=1 Tax=Pantoea sp. LMR881 TaxID=3014336 RepID=UPI0022B0703B|nr:baseplate protein [Pantoea sp. LMR881]MCZ4061257.1 baseplate protein [Pantoea sp. LMR881]